MSQARCDHSATLLANGDVLVAGGTGSNTLVSAELYSPATGTWRITGNLNVARANGASVLLADGQVLVAGGYSFVNGSETILTSAELYNPSSGLWSLTAGMAKGIFSPVAVLLPTNDLLVANEAQFFIPGTATWTKTGALPKTAENPIRATLLATGNVLPSGTVCSCSGCGHLPTAVCFLYTTVSSSWSVAGSMNHARVNHSSTLLPNGKVLVAGGNSRGLDGGTTVLSSSEFYTP